MLVHARTEIELSALLLHVTWGHINVYKSETLYLKVQNAVDYAIMCVLLG
jgi:hypothetical protein